MPIYYLADSATPDIRKIHEPLTKEIRNGFWSGSLAVDDDC